MPPTLANGKICYLEIPAGDARRSADFYEHVFGWRIRRRGDDDVAFDDTTEEASGTWVGGRPPSSEPGLLVYIMVDSVAETVDAVTAHGGEIVQPGPTAARWTSLTLAISPSPPWPRSNASDC
jgi:predicted enzyme related to lactoylglutathione lyase